MLRKFLRNIVLIVFVSLISFSKAIQPHESLSPEKLKAEIERTCLYPVDAKAMVCSLFQICNYIKKLRYGVTLSPQWRTLHTAITHAPLYSLAHYVYHGLYQEDGAWVAYTDGEINTLIDELIEMYETITDMEKLHSRKFCETWPPYRYTGSGILFEDYEIVHDPAFGVPLASVEYSAFQPMLSYGDAKPPVDPENLPLEVM